MAALPNASAMDLTASEGDPRGRSDEPPVLKLPEPIEGDSFRAIRVAPERGARLDSGFGAFLDGAQDVRVVNPRIGIVLDGVKAMPAKYPGMTRVWTNSFKVQNQRGAEIPVTHVFVMEFADKAAFDGYTGSPAQLEWYKIYEPVRERSTTHDITN